MVISDANRYLFIEVPQTASSALADELVENYGGRRILRKHTDYSEFLRSASDIERSYAVMATVRNPLDIVVSKFAKARDNHRNSYKPTKTAGAPWGYRFRPEAREYAYISRHNPDFAAYVKKFFPRVYNGRACLLPDHAHVLRYERLNDDLEAWLRKIGLKMLRPLPWRHVTSGRERGFSELFEGDLRAHAMRVFGPYMRRWGYEFPQDWPAEGSISKNEFNFKLDTAIRRFYFRHIHYGWIMPRAQRRPGSPRQR
jgi:hypothetical protein